MAETGGAKPATTTWAEGAGAIVEVPSAGRIADGHILYKPKFGVFNWFWQLIARLSVWLGATHVREFEELGEALTVVSTPGERFRLITDDNTHMLEPGLDIWKVAVDLTPVFQATDKPIACDGIRTFYCGTPGLVAAFSEDGVTDWSIASANFGQGVGSDGDEVVYTNVSTNTIFWVNADDGTAITSAAWAACTVINSILVKHGQYTIGAVAGAGTAEIRMWKNHASVWSVASPFAGTHFTGIAECFPVRDGERLVIACGGTNTDANNVFAYELETGATRWSWAFPDVGTVNDCCSDGERIFVATDNSASRNVFALDVDGNLIWTFETSSGADAVSCCVDERAVYVMDTAERLKALDKATGQILWSQNLTTELGASSFSALCCDGDSIFGAFDTSVAAEDILRFSTGKLGASYVRVDESSDFRRPVVGKCIPIGGI